jgi:hypothetical protein
MGLVIAGLTVLLTLLTLARFALAAVHEAEAACFPRKDRP